MGGAPGFVFVAERFGRLWGCVIARGPSTAALRAFAQDDGKNNSKDNGKSNGRSRLPSGMTNEN